MQTLHRLKKMADWFEPSVSPRLKTVYTASVNTDSMNKECQSLALFLTKLIFCLALLGFESHVVSAPLHPIDAIAWLESLSQGTGSSNDQQWTKSQQRRLTEMHPGSKLMKAWKRVLLTQLEKRIHSASAKESNMAFLSESWELVINNMNAGLSLPLPISLATSPAATRTESVKRVEENLRQSLNPAHLAYLVLGNPPARRVIPSHPQ